jgi:hypothetical protein
MPILRGRAGSGRLRRLVEESLGREALLQLLEGRVQGAKSRRFEMLANDLILALRS